MRLGHHCCLCYLTSSPYLQLTTQLLPQLDSVIYYPAQSTPCSISVMITHLAKHQNIACEWWSSSCFTLGIQSSTHSLAIGTHPSTPPYLPTCPRISTALDTLTVFVDPTISAYHVRQSLSIPQCTVIVNRHRWIIHYTWLVMDQGQHTS